MENKNETTGWKCPSCGRIYAPWVSQCWYCGDHSYTWTRPTCPYWPNWITIDDLKINWDKITCENKNSVITNNTATGKTQC